VSGASNKQKEHLMNTVETVQDQETVLNIKTILVAVDLSFHSEKTVAYALAVARRFGASLKLIHVYTPPTSTEFGMQDTYSLLEQDREDAQRRLAALADQVRRDYPKCEYLLRTGDPSEQITNTANLLGADLIVTACHHQTVVGHLLNLDQAPKIIHRARCPVLVWRDEEP
jgi:nucleotide-binding universal stress UspA family protein